MNKVIEIGNLVRDVEYSTTPNGIAVAKFTLAVQRKYANADGNRECDFINCVAWRNQAEFINKYFKKGSKIAVVGSLQTRTYEANDGTKRYITEVVVDEVEFAGEKKQEEQPKIQPIQNDTLPF